MDLFSFQQDSKPQARLLADRLRPEHLDEYIGQEHIIGPGKLLRRAIEADQIFVHLVIRPAGMWQDYLGTYYFPANARTVRTSECSGSFRQGCA